MQRIKQEQQRRDNGREARNPTGIPRAKELAEGQHPRAQQVDPAGQHTE